MTNLVDSLLGKMAVQRRISHVDAVTVKLNLKFPCAPSGVWLQTVSSADSKCPRNTSAVRRVD